MTDMSHYHTFDHRLSTMSVSQLHAAIGEIERNLAHWETMCSGTLIDIETFRSVERSEKRKIKAINRRIRQLQDDAEMEYQTMTECAVCGKDMVVSEAHARIHHNGFVCADCLED